NIANETISVFSGSATLSATGQGGSLSITPTVATLAAGVWTGNVTVAAVDPAVLLSAAVSGGIAGNSNTFAVQAGPVASFQWSTVSSPKQANQGFGVTITAKDAN